MSHGGTLKLPAESAAAAIEPSKIPVEGLVIGLRNCAALGRRMPALFNELIAKLGISRRRSARLLAVSADRAERWAEGKEQPYGPAIQMLKLMVALGLSADQVAAALIDDAPDKSKDMQERLEIREKVDG
jgi:DNA-binding transcriptional regulator YiaG